MHIRYILAGTVALLASFTFALPALANTTNLSFDPALGTQPFSFYCQPYIMSFETGKHYVAQNGGRCFFTMPNSVVGNKFVSIFKGVPGNSTLVVTDPVTGAALNGNPPTLVQEDNTPSFGTPSQDQNYFGVVYGGTAEQAQFQAAFSTGSSTNTLLPSDNYKLIQWKWGSKPTSEFDPVIIIPDMLNTWQKDTGSIVDPLFHLYQNLIDTFTSNGYVLDQTLFTLPYNWEDSNVLSAQALQAKIQSIKATCGCSRVDIVAHGMGGLIAEQYVESAGYQNDVDQIVFLGTPFSGAPAAYQAWEGGQVSFGNPLSDGLAQVFLKEQALSAGFTTPFAFIQNKPVNSFKELLPTYDYLFDNIVGERVYPTGYPQNTFLENILAQFNSTLLKRARIYSVLGDDGQNLTQSAFVVATSVVPPLWPDGQIIDTPYESGDGMVPRTSIENIAPANQQFTATHRALPNASQSYAFNVLNNKNPVSVVNTNYPVSCVLFVTTSSTTDMQIKDPSGARIGKDFLDNTILSEIPNSFYTGFSAVPEYGIITNPINGGYEIRTQGSSSGTFTLNASDICGPTVTATSTTSTVPVGQLVGFTVTVSTSTQTLNIQSLDVNPPLIVITSPANNGIYLQNATTSITTTITDPENSPIANTTYNINGSSVNPLQPLQFSTLPLGTSTLVVSATDVFGNKGFATSSFFVKIGKSPLTITADNKTMLLGGVAPALTATLTGFIGGDTLATSGVVGSASCTTTATSASQVGSYPITCTVGTLSSNKYSFQTFVAGVLKVVYRWDGFLQPINDTAHQIGQDLSVFKGGSTVPAKIQLKRADGTVVQSATLPVWLTPVQIGPMSAAVDELQYSDPATSGNTYTWDGSMYKYNWSTKGLASGYWYRIYAKFDDGTTATVVIGLR